MNKLSILLLFLTAPILGQSADTLLLQLKEQQNIQRFYKAHFQNPATMPEWGKYRFSTVQTAYEKSDKEAYALQYPQGHNAFSVTATSFFPYDSTRTLWGDASYTNRTLRNIRWNESVDSDLIYPYFTADEVGGDLKSEQYTFKGGFAKQWQRLLWGIVLDYEAELASRSKDPRPKDITSNLQLRSGFAVPIGKWQMGAYGSFQKYTQSNELKFFNELGTPTVYHLNGLGHYNNLLKGNKHRVFYEGYGYGGGIEISEKNKKDLFLTANYKQITIEKYMTDDNGVIAATLTNQLLNAELVKLFRRDIHTYGLKLQYEKHSKEGIEPILSARNSNWTEVIAKNKNYTLKDERYQLSLLFYADNSLQYQIEPYASYQTYREDYTLVRSFQHFDYLNLGMKMSATTPLGSKNIGYIALRYQYRNALQNGYLLRNDSEIGLSEMLLHNANYLSLGYNFFEVNLQYYHKLSGSLSYFAGINTEIGVFSNQRINTFYLFKAGIVF